MSDAVYCAVCDEKGVETLMRWDADFGGHLCPVCEPLDVKLIGQPEARVERYARVYGDTTPPAEATVAEYRAAVEKVRALADEWDANRARNGRPMLTTANVVDRLSAALAGLPTGQEGA